MPKPCQQPQVAAYLLAPHACDNAAQGCDAIMHMASTFVIDLKAPSPLAPGLFCEVTLAQDAL